MIEISGQFPKRKFLAKYPRVFRADSLEDMQKGRAEEAKGLRRKVGIVPTINFGDQPNGVASDYVAAIIYLPPLQHYPAKDPQEDVKGLYGLTLHENMGMKLSDGSGSINVWYDNHAFLRFPFVTSFETVDVFGNRDFDKDEWRSWREVSWRRPVILFAQYSETDSLLIQTWKEMKTLSPQQSPVTEYYWLLHVFDPEGQVVRRKGRERVAVPGRVPIPVFTQI